MSKSRLVRQSYKVIHSIVPCLMLTMSVGMIYAFSLFIPEITEVIGASRGVVQFAFNLSIFFLGMGAAFFGPIVEKDIRRAAMIATALFVSGLALTAIAVTCKNIWMLYMGIGVMCGIGEGIAYLCPCKNMLLWYSKSRFKGLVMAISIVTFGLGSSLCAQVYGLLHPHIGMVGTLWTLTVMYAVMMTMGTWLIRKPRFDQAKKNKEGRSGRSLPLWTYVKNPYVQRHWLFMFFNISMGLILIGSCASILKATGMAMGDIVLVMSLCGIANGAGRIVFPLLGDFFDRKGKIIAVIIGLEMLLIAPSVVWFATIPMAMVCINATYGGGFATCPQIVLERFGSRPLSVIHGLLLSAWGIASLFAYVVTMLIVSYGCGYLALPWVLCGVYAITLIVTKRIWHDT